MFAVYKREFRAYMSNVYGWMFMAVLLLFVGFMVFRENLSTGVPYLEYALLGSKYVLFLMIPILCMRSMAEDRRNKTDMFYLSLPLRTRSVVVGKYLALLTVYAIPCAVIAVYPVLLRVFGVVNFVARFQLQDRHALKAGLAYVGQLGTRKMLAQEHAEHGRCHGVFLLHGGKAEARMIGAGVDQQPPRALRTPHGQNDLVPLGLKNLFNACAKRVFSDLGKRTRQHSCIKSH